MYKKNTNSIIKHLDFIILDIICFCLAFYVAYIVRHKSFDMFSNSLYLSYIIIIIFLYLVFAISLRNYKSIVRRGYALEFKKVVVLVTAVLVGLIFISFLQKETGELSRITIMAFYFFSITFIYIERTIRKRRVIASLQAKPRREVLLVSDALSAKELICKLNERSFVDFNIKGVVLLEDDERIGETLINDKIEDIPIIANDESKAFCYIEKNVVDEIIFTNIKEEKYKSFLEKCEIIGITVHIIIDEINSMIGETTVEKVAGVPMVSSSIKLVSTSDLLLKRLLDILGAIVGLIITGISFIFVAPAILIADPGPIFFSQERIGMNGRRFKIYKYRSMYMDAEKRKAELMSQNEMQGLMFKMEHDPRIIGSGKDGTKRGLGWCLRTFSIDELPQFWNILKGDMSLVGTRPPTVDEWEQYDIYHRIRMRIKPGLTGLWQVSGRSNITDFEEVVKLDSEYIRSWSFSGDLKIIFRTIGVVLKKEGSK